MTVACERALLGRWVDISGVGVRLCEDTGSAIGPGRVDIFVLDHNQALTLGVLRTIFWVDPCGGNRMRVTYKFLGKHKACENQRAIFRGLFPDGTDTTVAALLKGVTAGLNIGWLERFIPAPAREEYD